MSHFKPFGWLLGCAVVLGGTTFAGDSPSAERDPGVWQKRQYSFAFMGFTTTYSCDGLAAKLKVLLIAAGARSDAKATAGACASGFGRPDKFARADLTFYTLAPANASDSDAASVSGAAPTAGMTSEGIWKPVAFAARRPRELATGDCELIEQFRDSVLPMFSTRNIDSHTTCVPHQESGSVIDLKFDAFGVPPKAAAPAKT